MKNKNTFENIIKSKLDGLEQIPPARLKGRLTKKLNPKKTERFQWKKITLITIGSLLLLTFLSYKLFQNTNPKIPQPPIEKIQQANQSNPEQFDKEHRDKHKNGHGHDHTAHQSDSTEKEAKVLVAQTPDDIKNQPYVNARIQAKTEQKLIFIHAFNLDCNHCQKMKEITLADTEVKNFLQEHFVKIDIDMQKEENFEVIRFYDIRTTPKYLFLNGDGQLVTISGGFHEPKKFMEILEKAKEEEAAGTYIDLLSKKRVNPTPNKLKKTNPLEKIRLPDSILMKVADSEKLILVTVFEEECPKCEQLETKTFADNGVKKVMNTRLYRWTIDFEQAKNLGLLTSTNEPQVPTTFIFSDNGIWLTKFEGYIPPKSFLNVLRKAISKNSSQNNGIHLLTATVFPNPTNGQFKAGIKGKKSPLQIKIIDLNGKVILEKSENEFNGEREYDFDLTSQKGHFIIQFSQRKTMIYKKIIVQ